MDFTKLIRFSKKMGGVSGLKLKLLYYYFTVACTSFVPTHPFFKPT